ncbi:hypothetical protein FJY69_04105 [candidate division WOR-3 bacterium]|nr:hypothetical protein [candidate division WOR-3 bacterium]
MRGLLSLFCCLVALGCSQVKTLSRADALSDGEKLDYLVLASIAPEAGTAYLTAGTKAGRADYIEWFWNQSPLAVEQGRYHERAVQARTFFGQLDLFGDERVRTYIKFGPARREVFQAKTTRTESLTIVVPAAEIWTYDSLGLQFDFVKTGVAYKQVGRSEFGPRVTMPALEQVDLGRTPPKAGSDARPLGLAVALGRLGQEADSVHVELHYGIPLAELARAFGTNQPLVHVKADFLLRGTGRGQTIVAWVSTRVSDDTAGLAVGREVLVLPVGVYSVRVTAVTADGKGASVVNRELNLLDYVRRAQLASDVVFFSLADSAFQSPQFVGHGWQRLVPMVEPSIKSGQTCYVLYQVYNLSQGSTGQHRLQIDYDFIEESTRQLAFAATPPRFVSGPGNSATVVERLHTMNLRPGSYLIVARVRDLELDRVVSLTTRLRIVPR